MSMTRQTLIASRPAATALALALAAAMTVPAILLPRAHGQTTPAPAAACTQANNNGCTELSPTPPEDTVAVPPNIVLMLDDSGSMAWDYMPDACYLYGVACSSSPPGYQFGSGCVNGNSPINNVGKGTGQCTDYVTSVNNNAMIDSANNGVYYNPNVTYTPPPQYDGTPYPSYADMTNVPLSGFSTGQGNQNVSQYSDNDIDGEQGYPGGTLYYGTAVTFIDTALTDNYTGNANSSLSCTNTYQKKPGSFGEPTYTPNTGPNAFGGTCTFTYHPQVTQNFFQYSIGPAAGPYVVYYVAPPASNCSNAPTPANCVASTDTSGTAAPAGIAAGANIANWFAYDHTRVLMAKTGLMTAFNNLSPKYRFGFGSIDGGANGDANNLPQNNRYSYTDHYNGGTNYIAEVQPFGTGDGSDQRTAFWNWISQVTPSGGTPLRQALNAVGQYYMTAQPWSTMPGDPGYTQGSNTEYACRASYAIMTTDGFWNGYDPGTGNVANSNGTLYTGVNDQTAGYTAVSPFTDAPGVNGATTLADVATYYWETDLQPNLMNEVPSSKADPAFWQHMTTFTMGLGFTPIGITGTAPDGDNPPTEQDIFNWAHDGGGSGVPSAITGFSWPTPASNSIYNIADLMHAAVNGHGDFFSAKSPQELAAGFSHAIAEINARVVPPTTGSVNSSVTTAGALSFSTGYNPGDWSGQLIAVTLNQNGAIAPVTPTNPGNWDAGSQLNAAYHNANYTKRRVYTDAYKIVTDATTGVITSATFNNAFANGDFQFIGSNVGDLDGVETLGLDTPALVGEGKGNDTTANRIDYLLGDTAYEQGYAQTGDGLYRDRNSLLGAIIHSQPLYVSYPGSNYTNDWPSGSPEADACNTSASPPVTTGCYDTFQQDYSTRPGTLYVGANDGMLHAFAAPAPTGCTADGSGCNYGDGGAEDWAFVPRAVYGNLGNLTDANFSYLPTVDATPVTRDVFFSQGAEGGQPNDTWHTILVGGVGLGGRGVYALDITGASKSSAQPTAPNGVLWEFDSDMTMSSGCVASYGNCLSSDLGYTIAQPNIGRIGYNNEWVVLMPNGYFPDCTTPDSPANPNVPANSPSSCTSIAAQAPSTDPGKADGVPYSALFVIDAQTGNVVAELKTPAGIPSFGLATPVLGDFDSGQVDEVAFAGDEEGNLWRFNLTGAPTNWTVTLAYKGVANAAGQQGIQPITTMPRLLPDPTTNGFMVVFGTGKYLGVGDNVTPNGANGQPIQQAVYGIRQGPTPNAAPYTQSNLVQRFLYEVTAPSALPGSTAGNPNAGATLRCITATAVPVANACGFAGGTTVPPPMASIPASDGGWYFNLDTTTSDGTQNDVGERVVVTPGAIFASNTVVIQTLITGGTTSNPCDPSVQGAVMFIDAVTGGPGQGVSSLGGGNIVGARVNNARTSGTLPVVSAMGGGQLFVPGMTLTNSTSNQPITGDLPIWRRRSWREINQG